MNEKVRFNTSNLVNEMISQQSQQISGTVSDLNGDPIPGVSVIIKGSKIGTATDVNGSYTLSNVPNDAVLVYSFIGMKSQEVPVAGQSVLDIILEEEAIGLQEVVAIGYGTQKKVNLTGAVSVVDKEVFENKTVPNAMAALQGALPGVTVTKTSGKPGAENYQMMIRGASSANNVNILVIIDGTVGSLNELNPSDIESLTVLKDAAASSIYGSNAAGGVILVTTKKGTIGTPKFEITSMFGYNTPSRLPTRLDSWVEMDMFNQAHINAGEQPFWTERQLEWMQGINLDKPDETGVSPSMFFPGERFVVHPGRPNVWRSYDNVDPIDMLISRHNPMHQHNLSVRGGTEISRYYISFGYYNRSGIMKNGPDDDEKYNLRLNLNNKLTEHIFLNTSLAYINKTVQFSALSPENILTQAYKLWTTIPSRRPDGEYHAGNGIWDSLERVQKEGGKDLRRSHYFDGKAEINFKELLPGWDVNIVGSKRIGTYLRNYHQRSLVYNGPLGEPTLISTPSNWMLKNQSLDNYSSLQIFSTYNKSYDNAHNFTLLGGYSYENYRYEFFQTGINNLVTNDFFSLNWGDPNTLFADDEILTSRTMAFFGRLNYNFKEKYLFEANLRYDASSKLAPSHRWNLFPSLSAGWNISDENFFQDVDFIDNLKLRASWGQLGNSDALGYYDYIGMLNAGKNLPFNDTRTQYIYQGTLASEQKTWETIETSNIGIDVAALDYRLKFSGDVYVKRNKNMLAYLQRSSIIGVGLPTYNVGELKTNGWEINLSWNDQYKNFKYWIAMNLSDNTNKLVSYEGQDVISGGMVSLLEGYPLNSLWGYKTDGLFQSDQEYEDYGVYISTNTGEGDMKYLDLDGDKKINAGDGTKENHGDLVYLGDNNPRYLYGLNFGFEWKGIDFSCLFQGVGKRSFFLNSGEMIPLLYDWKMPFKEHLDYWTPENRDAFWPRLYSGSDHSYWSSDYWAQNAAYLRLKNVELGYSMPTNVIEKLKLDKARFFITGQDLFEFTNVLSWVDPEFPQGSGTVYPFVRSVTIGLNLTF